MITRIVLLVPFLLTAGLMLWAPRLAPRHTFFGVRVPSDFRESNPGRHAWRIYCRTLALATVAGIVGILAWPNRFWIALCPPLLLFVVSVSVFIWNNRRLRRFRMAPPAIADVELSADPDCLPRFFWLTLVPLAVLAGTAVYLDLHWSEIPLRYPVHWGANGQPNGWSTRSFRGVYGQLIFGGLLMSWMVAMAVAVWYRARRSPMRIAFTKTMVSVEALMGVLWSFLALSPVLNPSAGLTSIVIFGCVIATVAFSLVTLATAASQTYNDGTREERWAAGYFYKNQDDPSWFVPRRDGLGYAPNLAHWAPCALVLGPVLIVLLGLKFVF